MDFIEVYPNTLSAEFCQQLINTLNTHPARQPGQTGNGVDPAKKNSIDIMLDAHVELTPLKNQLLQQCFTNMVDYFNKYALTLMGAVSVGVDDGQGNTIILNPDNYQEHGSQKAAALVKYLYRSGNINLQHYQQSVGGYPHWHSEQFPQQPNNEALHRVLLYMVYLNDVEQGGETEFYYQQRKIQPKQGTMVIAPAGFTHSHRGNVPLSGDKYIATSWLMFNRAEQLYGQLK